MDTRRNLLELKLSAGLAAAAPLLQQFVLARPDATLPDCLRMARILTVLALSQVPYQYSVVTLLEVLDELRSKGGAA